MLAPGWTVYEKRLQVQEYDITELLENENELFVTVGKGWFSSPMPGWMESEDKIRRKARPRALLAEVCIKAENDTTIIGTDESWLCGESSVRFSEIYDGEVYDASFETKDWKNASLLDWSMLTSSPKPSILMYRKPKKVSLGCQVWIPTLHI